MTTIRAIGMSWDEYFMPGMFDTSLHTRTHIPALPNDCEVPCIYINKEGITISGNPLHLNIGAQWRITLIYFREVFGHLKAFVGILYTFRDLHKHISLKWNYTKTM